MDANERRDRASREAADWWALLQDAGMTRVEREAFIDWLRDSKTNIAEMLRLSQVHDDLERFQGWADISTVATGSEGAGNVVTLGPADRGKDQERPAEPRSVSRASKILWALATSVAMISIVTTVLLAPQWRGRSIVTDRGERREVVLDDGSVVLVDPQTRLNFHYAKDLRQIQLERGRAVFRVAQDPTRPFLVRSGDTSVRAIGTAFGVEQRAHNVLVVTVSEGKVAVSSGMSGLQRSPSDEERQGVRAALVHPARIGSGEVVVAANQQVMVANDNLAAPVQEVNSSRELAWAEGRLVFKNDPVEKIVSEFNRYNRIQLKVLDPTLAQRPISGVFDAENPEAFIAFLQNAAAVHIERDDGRVILISVSEAP